MEKKIKKTQRETIILLDSKMTATLAKYCQLLARSSARTSRVTSTTSKMTKMTTPIILERTIGTTLSTGIDYFTAPI